MYLKKWENLPEEFKNEAVRPYYEYLKKKQISLIFKRIFDIFVSIILLILLSPIFLALAIFIKIDSKGPVFFRQSRVTQYNKEFKIFKFRTMVNDAEKLGAQVTSQNDSRITKVGEKIRKYRLDEISQLINVLIGDMTFVGTRPEVRKYVDAYTDEMMATLLLPAGITSNASIEYKDEDEILNKYSDDVDEAYIKYILPEKMRINLSSIMNYGFFRDIKTMIDTVIKI